MRPAEQGFLLLSGTLGDVGRHPLTAAQLRNLAQRMKQMLRPTEDRELTAEDLLAIGYRQDAVQRIIQLLSDNELLDLYLSRARKAECTPLTRVSVGYPKPILDKLGDEAPGTLWIKGDISLLSTKMIALAGSRDIQAENAHFAREVGIQAAKQGYTLVSGNARGADRNAQDACLEHGGNVICIVADSLEDKEQRANVLYISEEDFDAAFSAQRAHSRNRLIHCLSQKTFIAQTDLRGGTWTGTVKNLNRHWSSVFCFDDGSSGALELIQMGATAVKEEDLRDIAVLQGETISFLAE